jgi:Fe-coproporphyrin III synthase
MGLLGRLRTIATGTLSSLPILVLMPHSRCNCRCVMCDIWKANQDKREISTEMLELHLPAFVKLGVKRVALSGGEALLHSNLWRFCELLRSAGIKISLLSTGITLKLHAREVVSYCDDVIVSLDGSKETHNTIRNLPAAFEKLAEGVGALKAARPGFRVTGRTVLQKQNFRCFPDIVQAAKNMNLDQISFLAADVSSQAFNRPDPWSEDRKSEVALTPEEAEELEAILRRSWVDFKADFVTGFIAESQNKLLNIVEHYRAANGQGNFPEKKCNAPWVSAVIESTGDVLPCFFHKPYGNLQASSFEDLINSKKAISFRKQLDIKRDPVCQQCVCSLHVGITQRV